MGAVIIQTAGVTQNVCILWAGSGLGVDQGLDGQDVSHTQNIELKPLPSSRSLALGGPTTVFTSLWNWSRSPQRCCAVLRTSGRAQPSTLRETGRAGQCREELVYL